MAHAKAWPKHKTWFMNPNYSISKLTLVTLSCECWLQTSPQRQHLAESVRGQRREPVNNSEITLTIALNMSTFHLWIVKRHVVKKKKKDLLNFDFGAEANCHGRPQAQLHVRRQTTDPVLSCGLRAPLSRPAAGEAVGGGCLWPWQRLLVGNDNNKIKKKKAVASRALIAG